MSLNQAAVIREIDQVLEQCDISSHNNFDDYSNLPKALLSEKVNLLFSAIRRLSPSGSVYIDNGRTYEKWLAGNIGLAIDPLVGILRALRSDYESGRLQSVQELIHADVFADFLEMAEYLLQQGYKDPAAVILGSTLEEHLRKMCSKHGIDTKLPSGVPKKADALNNDLAAAVVYSKLDQKSITAWLDLRNKAAHGKYAEYTDDQVELMLQGVQNFMTRLTA